LDEMDDHIPDDIVPYSTLEHTYKPREGRLELPPGKAVGKYLEAPVLHYTIGTPIRPSVVNTLKEFGVKQIQVHDEPPPFQPEMIRGMYNLQHDQDWMTQMFGSGLKKSLQNSTHRGASSDPTGTSYVPGLAQGVNFGRIGKVRTPGPVVPYEPPKPPLKTQEEESPYKAKQAPSFKSLLPFMKRSASPQANWSGTSPTGAPKPMPGGGQRTGMNVFDFNVANNPHQAAYAANQGLSGVTSLLGSEAKGLFKTLMMTPEQLAARNRTVARPPMGAVANPSSPSWGSIAADAADTVPTGAVASAWQKAKGFFGYGGGAAAQAGQAAAQAGQAAAQAAKTPATGIVGRAVGSLGKAFSGAKSLVGNMGAAMAATPLLRGISTPVVGELIGGALGDEDFANPDAMQRYLNRQHSGYSDYLWDFVHAYSHPGTTIGTAAGLAIDNIRNRF